MNENGEISEDEPPRSVWLIYYGLAWFYTFGIIISSCIGFFYIRREYIDVYKYMPYVEYSIQLAFLVACIGAVTRRSWAAHWVGVTAVWFLAVYWSGVPSLIECTVGEILYGPAVVIGGGPDVRNMPYPPYFYLLAKLVGLVLLLSFVITSHLISKQQAISAAKTERTGSTKAGRLLYGGIMVMLFGLMTKWVDLHIEQQIYAMTIGSYLLVAGAVLILIWHVLAREFFISASVTSTSAIIFIYRPAIVPVFYNFVLWLPPLATGMLSLLRREVGAKLRTVVIGLPVVFILISFSGSVIEIPLYMRFGPYHKETSQRPADLPEYLQVPLRATKARYQGGERPHLSFTIEDPYPATKTLNFISSNLEEAGWRKLDYDLLNPSFESSHLKGWYSPLERWFGPKDPNSEGQSHTKPCLWDASWMNERDETVRVRLTYRLSEEGKIDWTDLHCSISVSPADPMQLEFTKHYRRVHPEGNEPNKAEEPSEHSDLF
jgi:hypothetical protein